MQKLQIRDINLRYLIDKFGLQRVRNSEFFREWQENLPEVTDSEKQLLDRVQDIYFNLVDTACIGKCSQANNYKPHFVYCRSV